MAFEGQLQEQLEQVSEADCVEAGRPTLELPEQREQMPRANCVEAERPVLGCESSRGRRRKRAALRPRGRRWSGEGS